MWDDNLGVLFAAVRKASAGPGAGGSLSRKESASSFLATTVSSIASTSYASHAVEKRGERQASNSSPHETESLYAESGSLAVGVEVIATLYITRTKKNC